MRRILITGSEGFVGQHAISLLKKDYLIVGLSKSTVLDNENNVEYVLGDILDKNAMSNLLKKYKPDIILHLAGIAKTWDNDPVEVLNVNLVGTLNVYEAVLSLKKESGYDPKIVFISSAECYGKIQNLQSISEENLLNPINDYGVSKAAADRLSYEYSQSHDLNIVILRPFPHIGPGQRQGFFVPDVMFQIVELERNPNRNELLVGNLQSIRDYTDVRDVVAAYKIAIETEFTPGEVYNICSGEGVKIADLLKKILAISQKPLVVKEDPEKLRSMDLQIFVGNNQKFVSKTGWRRQYPLDKTLIDTIEYWRNLHN